LLENYLKIRVRENISLKLGNAESTQKQKFMISLFPFRMLFMMMTVFLDKILSDNHMNSEVCEIWLLILMRLNVEKL
jgi:hypothetical protein